MERTYFIISAAGTRSVSPGYRQRWQKSPITLYISKATFAPGVYDGMRPKKIWHTADKAKAYKFSKFAAEGIAEYLKGPTWRMRDVKIEPVVVELNQA